MKKYLEYLVCLVCLVGLACLASCSEEEQEYDPYYNWPARNAAWYEQIADSARKNADGKWLMLKSLQQSQSYNSGSVTDSICVHIISQDATLANPVSPKWNDTIRISYRGWLMPTTYKVNDDNEQLVDSVMQEVFDQSYYGPFDPEKALPRLSAVSLFVDGFHTALQYMVAGDNWLVYIPYQLAYGTTAHGTIPGYSTLLFHIHMAAVYPSGSGVPDWQ